MTKYFLQIGGIILGNLFAFLVLGHILDLIFGANAMYKIIFIFLSVPSLVIMMYIYSKKIFTQLQDISANGKPD